MAKEMTTVVKMTINSKEYEQGLQNCKASMSKFSMSTKNVGESFNAVMGSMVKKIGLVGIALAAKDGFKAFMTSTEDMKDGFENEIGAMSDAWKSLLFQINNGNLQGFRDVIDYARKARQALDELGDAAALFNLDYGENSARATELLSTIQKKKKSGQDYTQEVADYNSLINQLREDNKLANQKSLESLEGLFGMKVGSLLDYGTNYREAARLARMAAAGKFSDVNTLNSAYAANIDVSEVSDFDTELPRSRVDELKNAWDKSRYNRAEFLRTLGNIPEEDKDAIEKVLKEMSQRDQAVASMEKALNRYLNSEDGGGGGKTTATPYDIKDLYDFSKYDTTGRFGKGNIDLNRRKVVKNSDGSISTERSFSTNIDGMEVLLPTVINGMIVSIDDAIEHYFQTGEHLGKFTTVKEAEKYADMLHKRQDWYYNTYLADPKNLMQEYLSRSLPFEVLAADREKDSVIVDIELEEEDIVEPELDALIERVRLLNQEWENHISNLNLYSSVISNAASAFSALGDAMGNTPFGALASTMGTVAQQISNLVQMYLSLVAVEAVAESIKAGNGIPFPYNLIAIAAAVTALATIISSAKSNFAGQFADGGIVGGNSYTGDKLFARVNSGEMIIPYKDWRNGLGGGNVNFVIEGSQLRGVLDNYDKTASL